MKEDPAFKRVRENGKEFGACGRATKLLRAVLRPLMRDACDYLVTGRLNSLMVAVKNLDTSSARGERQVGIGIASQAAKDLIQGFDFNAQAPLQRVVKKALAVNTGTGVISIPGLVPVQDLAQPSGATHVSITGGWARFDFAAMPGKGELVLTNQVILPLTGALTNVALTPVNLPSGAGTDLFLVQVLFYQEINVTMYPLQTSETTALGIIGLG